MRSKTTLLLLAVFLALLAVVFFLKPKTKEEMETKLVDLKSEEVQKVELKKGTEVMAFERDNAGGWTVTAPFPAKADSFEVNRLVEDFASLKMEKVVEDKPADVGRYGLPETEVSLWVKGRSGPVKVVIGSANPLDNTLYARREGEERVVLLPSSIKSTIDKKLYDFRQKDVFHFEPGDVAGIRLRAKDIRWEAAQKDGSWFVQKPVSGLAQKTAIDAVLNALSGLRAKDFAAEQKTPQESVKFGLDKPDYEVNLALPKANQIITFLAHKKDDKIYATTSASNKIVVAEDQLLNDLEKRLDDLREKRVDVFSPWLADKLEVRAGGLDLVVTKDKDDKWSFLSGGTGEADQSKVESFIRLIADLEAVEFIDKPGLPASYGLDKPRAEVKVRTGEDPNQKKETVLLIGAEDKDKKQVIIKNPRFEYLFRVGSMFLDEFPKAAADWKKEEPKDKSK